MPKADAAFSRSNAVRHDHRLALREQADEAQYGTHSMPETADNVAAEFNIARRPGCLCAAQPAALGRVNAAGFFAGEIVPVTLPQKRRPIVFDTDEHPRPDVTLEQLAKLKGE